MTDKEVEAWANIFYRQTGKDSRYAYTITDKKFDEFRVLNSANAWWLDQSKVQRLIDAFKFDASVEEARAYAGISENQWKYFNKLHPDFSTVRAVCEQLPNLKARKTVVDNLDDASTAKWYLTKKKSKEFGDKIDVTSGNEPLQRTPEQIEESAKRTAEWMSKWVHPPTPEDSPSPTENKAKKGGKVEAGEGEEE